MPRIVFVEAKDKMTRIARLENGELVEYDACSSNLTADNDSISKEKIFLGTGTIWMINGVQQVGIEKYGFWKFKKS